MYWTDAVPQWAWIVIFWFVFLGFSMAGILAYGEIEFWLSLYVNSPFSFATYDADLATRIKVIAIIIFFICAIFISAGVIGPQKIGFKYWNDRERTLSILFILQG